MGGETGCVKPGLGWWYCVAYSSWASRPLGVTAFGRLPVPSFCAVAWLSWSTASVAVAVASVAGAGAGAAGLVQCIFRRLARCNWHIRARTDFMFRDAAVQTKQSKCVSCWNIVRGHGLRAPA